MRHDKPGKVIAGRYELLEPAGEGGMAVVWRAVARGAGNFARPVALKRVHTTKGTDPHVLSLFEEEARVGAALSHPNIVQILDFGLDEDGDYFLAMEWVQGLDLHQWVRSHPRGMKLTPWPLVLAIGVEVLRGLSAAHERIDEEGAPSPVIHRDVSPSNVMLGSNGTVKLTDFGLARAMDRASMTRPNVIKGKLAYCAPELVTGDKATAQSDLFGLGVVLWEALAQQRLFTGKNDLEVLLAVRRGEVEPLGDLRSDLPGAVTLAIHQALAPNPQDRFESARAMARALSAILRTHPEPVDQEPVGRSVREAMDRLQTARRIREANPPQPPSVQDLSLSDMELVESAPPPSVDVSISELSVPDGAKPKSNVVTGLWKDPED